MTVPGELAASVVIPAHNEGRIIGRLLDRLVPGESQAGLEVVVVCNGCTDDTAAVAARRPGVRVIEVPEPGKLGAMRHGSEAVSAFPRLYVDADVEISREDVLRLAAAVGGGTVLAAAPARRLSMEGVPRLVRWYHDVWQELPQVRSGLFGRGVVALSQEGQARLEGIQPGMNDDLAVSELFGEAEKVVVTEATVVVHPPRTVTDLLRRRTRVATGNTQADRDSVRSVEARTTPRTLAALAARRPRLLLKLPVFVLLTLAARARARRQVRRGDYTTWLRDESSRR